MGQGLSIACVCMAWPCSERCSSLTVCPSAPIMCSVPKWEVFQTDLPHLSCRATLRKPRESAETQGKDFVSGKQENETPEKGCDGAECVLLDFPRQLNFIVCH